MDIRQRIETIRESYPQFRQSGYGKEWVRQNKITLVAIPLILTWPFFLGDGSPEAAAKMTLDKVLTVDAVMFLVGIAMWLVWSYQVFQVWEGTRKKTFIA